MVLQQDIDRKPSMHIGFSTFGTRVILVALTHLGRTIMFEEELDSFCEVCNNDGSTPFEIVL